MATITVKNIPDELYRKLKAAAEINRRSINNEIISRIERSLLPRRVAKDQLIARVRRLHDQYEGPPFTLEEIEEARRRGQR